jgi:hypothetical protein
MSIPEKLRQAYHNDLTDVPLLLEAADEIDKWDRRWCVAVKTIAERDETIERLTAERNKLEDMWRERPTGTRNQRERQLTKRLEDAEALAFTLATQVRAAEAVLVTIESRASGYTHGDERVEATFRGIAELARKKAAS